MPRWGLSELVQFGQCGVQIVGYPLRNEPTERRIPGSRQATGTSGVSADTGPDNVEAYLPSVPVRPYPASNSRSLAGRNRSR